MQNQPEDLAELQRRYAFLANVTSSSLEHIRLVAEDALRERHEAGELPAWSRGNDGALRELLDAVERAKRDVQLASAFSATAAPPVKGAGPSAVPDIADSDRDERARAEEVSRAHQLARVLQERNTIKASLMNVEGNYASLQRKFSAVSEEHSRLLQALTRTGAADASAGDAAAALADPRNAPLEVVKEAMRQLYDRRVRVLEEELMSAREEVRRVGAEGGEGRTRQRRVAAAKLQEVGGCVGSGRTSSAGGEREDSKEGLRRQNTFLRNKLALLREELHVSQQAATGSAEQTREGLGRLLTTITGLRQEVAAKERQRAAAVLAQEEATQKAEQLAARVAALDRRSPKAACEARRGTGFDGAPPTLAAALAEREAELRQLQRDVSEREVRVGQLTRVLAKTQELLREKEGMQATLQLKASEAQGMWEAAQAQLQHTRVQETALAGLEQAVRHAVAELRRLHLRALGDEAPAGGSDGGAEAHLSGALQRRLDGILERLRELEWLELQLRQRDDAIVVLQDEKAELEERSRHLQQTLSNLSPLFHAIPQTPLQVEQLVLQRDALLAALRRCEELAVVPNTRETLRSIELREIELAARQSVRRRSPQCRPQLQQRAANSPAAASPDAAQAAAPPGRGRSEARLSCRSPSIVVEEQEQEAPAGG
ncbi:uncharacterized protein Tco025E_07473 [Trypanosoma conorhini]|uniref:Uncharacterized protein n=1 Tax=Trypanosoma conorhini TaxID=83891 RepID=A0A3R7MJD2_9TRYP|nr:uncharacterized protein Tco025E_07473 [Trypanosoma conorhini]RNF06961.1 hypothetical protein Tco025E_07473 [Trypanosoma conorhini]